MQNAKALVEINNTYREQLNEENKEFYEDILVYIRAKSFLKDELQLEESLLEILTDIIEAQNQGIKTADYFGKNPKEISDEILKNTNKSSFKERAKLFFSVSGIYVLVTIFPKLINPSEGIDVVKFLIGLVVTLIVINVIMNILGDSIYSSNSKKTTLSMIGLFVVYIILIVLMEKFMPNTFEVKLEGSLGIGIIVIGGGLGLVYSLREKLFYSFIPIIIVACTLGILTRLKSINFSATEQPGKTIVLVSMTIAFVLFYGISYIQARDDKDTK